MNFSFSRAKQFRCSTRALKRDVKFYKQQRHRKSRQRSRRMIFSIFNGNEYKYYDVYKTTDAYSIV